MRLSFFFLWVHGGEEYSNVLIGATVLIHPEVSNFMQHCICTTSLSVDMVKNTANNIKELIWK